MSYTEIFREFYFFILIFICQQIRHMKNKKSEKTTWSIDYLDRGNYYFELT